MTVIAPDDADLGALGEFGRRLDEPLKDPRAEWRAIARPDQLLPPLDDPWRVAFWRGGRGCIAPWTRIWLPLEHRYERVDVLAAAGRPVTVLALTPDGPRLAETDGAPFVKGTADLYEVITEDGHTVTVTDQHRFLTPQGWRRLAALRAGQLLAAGFPVPPATAARLSVSRAGALRSTSTGQGSTGHCRTCRGSCGPPPPPASGTGRVRVPSRGGAGGRNRPSWRRGDPDGAQGCNPRRLRRSRPARSNSARDALWVRAWADLVQPVPGARARLRSRIRPPSPGMTFPEREARVGAPYRSCGVRPASRTASAWFVLSARHVRGHAPRLAAGAAGRSAASRRSSPQGPWLSPVPARIGGTSRQGPWRSASRSSAASRLPLAAVGVVSSQISRTRGPRLAGTRPTDSGPARQPEAQRLACTDYPRWTRIRAIRHAGTGIFYDLTVPGPANYLAEGLWHHNSGKTRTCAQALAEIVLADTDGDGEYGIIAPTYADAWTKCTEGESGILRALGTSMAEVKDHRSKLVRSAWRTYGQVVLHNGTVIYIDSANDGALRVQGRNLKACWCDEIGLWEKWKVAWEESIRYAVRRGVAKVICDGTPKASRPARELVQSLLRDDPEHGGVISRRLRTVDNIENLSETFYRSVVGATQGTALEQQELEGELIADVPNSLWTRELLDEIQCPAVGQPGGLPYLFNARIGVDPSDGTESSDEQAYTVFGKGNPSDPHLYVAENWGGQEAPATFARRVILKAVEWDAEIIVEKNHGGAWLTTTFQQVMKELDQEGLLPGGRKPRVRTVTASQSKRTRAEPVSALYQRRAPDGTRILRHCKMMARDKFGNVDPKPMVELEDQMVLFTGAAGERSPDRLDSLVWSASPFLNTSFAPPGQPGVRKWAGSAELDGMGMSEEAKANRRMREIAAKGAPDLEDAPWGVDGLDGFGPQDDGVPQRGNVRSWRLSVYVNSVTPRTSRLP